MCIISPLQHCRHRSGPQADWNGYDHSGPKPCVLHFYVPVSPFPFLRSRCDKPLLHTSILSFSWKRPNHHPQFSSVKCDTSLSGFCFFYFLTPYLHRIKSCTHPSHLSSYCRAMVFKLWSWDPGSPIEPLVSQLGEFEQMHKKSVLLNPSLPPCVPQQFCFFPY